MIIARTSISHPIRVDELPLSNGMLGLTFCPGKKGSSLSGAPWDRDIVSYSPTLGQISGLFKLLPAPADRFGLR
jgi:hypothetical protein